MIRLPDGGLELTYGTHNLKRDTATVSGFADVIYFTEATAGRVRRKLWRTHRVFSSPDVPGVVTAVRRGLLGRGVTVRGIVAHAGEAGFTPRRGTLAVEGPVKLTGQDLALDAHHRINAAWPPYRFEESSERRHKRRVLWHRHQTLDMVVCYGQMEQGKTILAGGDGNRRRGHAVWPGGLVNHGEGTDRLAHTGDVEPVGTLEELSRLGSDHHRYRLTARLYARVNDRPAVGVDR